MCVCCVLCVYGRVCLIERESSCCRSAVCGRIKIIVGKGERQEWDKEVIVAVVIIEMV